MNVLEVNQLTKNFGGLTAVNDINFTVRENEILGLIGPNGAGKTTLFNLITGFIKPTSGTVFFKGADITGLAPDKIASKGISRTFQLATFFGEMTALENILVSLHLKAMKLLPMPRQLIKSTRTIAIEKKLLDIATDILGQFGLGAYSNEKAKNLPHGFQRLLSMAISLAVHPELMLLDEIISGMNAEEIEQVIKILHQIHKQGTTLILIEHNMKVAMSFCERFVVLNYGRKISEGSPEEIQKNEQVIQAYLGAKKEYTAD
jgi:branched-chain amino acid transport system ATP-binding protein